MRYSTLLLSLLTVIASSAVFAEENTPAHTVTGNFSLVSEYMVRGLTQTRHKPAVQGGVDYSHSSGFFLGAWGSNVSWLSDMNKLDADGDGNPDGGISNSLEVDYYGGYRFDLGPFKADLGLWRYWFPGTYPAGFTSPNTLETYGVLSYESVSLKYQRTLGNSFGMLSPDGQKTTSSQYFDLSANPEIAEGLTANLHLGYQTVTHYSNANYADWKIGVSKALDAGWSVGLAYYGTNAKKEVYANAYGQNTGASRVVLSLANTF
ncbi:MAG: hypothetical protein H6R19_525 [Proteobacteria bacterium]|nr:hypothetical protein [Pseudomonadota bacterium]